MHQTGFYATVGCLEGLVQPRACKRVHVYSLERILSTDEQGIIEVVTDGERIWIKTESEVKQ